MGNDKNTVIQTFSIIFYHFKNYEPIKHSNNTNKRKNNAYKTFCTNLLLDIVVLKRQVNTTDVYNKCCT